MSVGTGKEDSCPPCRLCTFLSRRNPPGRLHYPFASINCSCLRSVDSWVSRNRCTNLSTTDTDNGTVHFSSWTCAGVDAAVEHYREDDMGHVWASRKQTFSQAIMGEGPTKLEANDVIMKFFDRFMLDAESNDTSSITFTAASSVLLPVTQATGAGSLPTGTARATGSASPAKTASGTGNASPTASRSSAVSGNSGVRLFTLISLFEGIALALL